MKMLSFVIPCYGSEDTLPAVIKEIVDTVATRRSQYDYEIILVNDNSPDSVWSVIEVLSKENPRILGLHLARNFGQHSALMAGYAHATGDIVLSLDDDRQTPADEMFTLIDKLEEGYDVVYGCYAERKDSLFRKAGTYVNKMMTESLIGKPKNIRFTSYFAMRKFVVKEILRYTNTYPYIGGLVFRSTLNIANVPVAHRSRDVGKSHYTLKKLLTLWMNGFTAFSVKPLRISSFMGAVIAILGFIFGAYNIINKLLHPEIMAGYSTLIAALMFIGGMIMLMLGILGEYVGRMYISMNNAPQYVIREKIKDGVRLEDD